MCVLVHLCVHVHEEEAVPACVRNCLMGSVQRSEGGFPEFETFKH